MLRNFQTSEGQGPSTPPARQRERNHNCPLIIEEPDYLQSVVDQARKDGYTSTVLGRRRYLPELDSSNRNVRETAERAALNAPIQGSAADIIKVAMINTDTAIRDAGLKSRMLLQVHDELLFEVAECERETLDALVRDKMGGAYPLDVPLEVSVGYRRSWDAAAR